MLSTEVPSDRLCKGSKSFRATIIKLSISISALLIPWCPPPQGIPITLTRLLFLSYIHTWTIMHWWRLQYSFVHLAVMTLREDCHGHSSGLSRWIRFHSDCTLFYWLPYVTTSPWHHAVQKESKLIDYVFSLSNGDIINHTLDTYVDWIFALFLPYLVCVHLQLIHGYWKVVWKHAILLLSQAILCTTKG